MNELFKTIDIDLGEVGRTIWKRKFLVAGVTIAFIALALVYLHSAKRAYMVSMDVAPIVASNQTNTTGISALARLGGVDLSSLSGGMGQFRLFVSGLKSRNVADRLARDQPLMHALFRRQWSDTDNRWVEPSRGIVAPLSDGAKWLLGVPQSAWTPPGGQEVFDLIDSDLEVNDDPKSPIVELRILSTDPQTAKELLTKLTKSVDDQLRQQALDRANQYIAYLTKELDTVTVADYRAALINHLAEEEQIRMTASASVSFSAQTFSGPSVAARPESPKVPMVIIMAFIAGIITGSLFAWWLEQRSQRGLRFFVRRPMSSLEQQEI